MTGGCRARTRSLAWQRNWIDEEAPQRIMEVERDRFAAVTSACRTCGAPTSRARRRTCVRRARPTELALRAPVATSLRAPQWHDSRCCTAEGTTTHTAWRASIERARSRDALLQRPVALGHVRLRPAQQPALGRRGRARQRDDADPRREPRVLRLERDRREGEWGRMSRWWWWWWWRVDRWWWCWSSTRDTPSGDCSNTQVVVRADRQR